MAGPAPAKTNLGVTVVTDLNGAVTTFSGFLGKFGAAHPRLLAGLSLAAGLVLGWLVHVH